jgi:hypothetical protein
MTNAADLSFGLKQSTIEAPALWGARAILNTVRGGNLLVDIVWDRQDLKGEKEADFLALQRKLNGTKSRKGAIQAFCDAVFKGKVYPADLPEQVEPVTLKGVEFHACTMRNSGYLYITARLAPVPPEVNPAA